MCKSSRSLGRGSSLPWSDGRGESHVSSEKQLKSGKGDVHKPCVPAGSQTGCRSQDALRRLTPLEPRLAEQNAELAPLARTLWPGSCGQVPVARLLTLCVSCQPERTEAFPPLLFRLPLLISWPLVTPVTRMLKFTEKSGKVSLKDSTAQRGLERTEGKRIRHLFFVLKRILSFWP